MRYWVGFDVGKAFHWVCVLDEGGEIVLSRKVEATERELEACREELEALGGPEERKIVLDLVGGPATLLQAVLLEGGERLFHLSGMAVNRARDGYRGENKSDARDAWVIADQLRVRWASLQELRPHDEASAELRALVSHRRALVEDQARFITRLLALLLEIFPGLEAALDLRTDRALLAVARAATPSAARRLGVSRLARCPISSGDDDRVAATEQLPRQLEADAARSSGDQDRPVLQLRGRTPSVSSRNRGSIGGGLSPR